MCAIGSIVIAGVLVAGCEPKKPLHPQKVVATCDQEFRAETGQARQCVTITFSKVMPAKLQSIDLAREAQAEADARR